MIASVDGSQGGNTETHGKPISVSLDNTRSILFYILVAWQKSRSGTLSVTRVHIVGYRYVEDSLLTSGAMGSLMSMAISFQSVSLPCEDQFVRERPARIGKRQEATHVVESETTEHLDLLNLTDETRAEFQTSLMSHLHSSDAARSDSLLPDIEQVDRIVIPLESGKGMFEIRALPCLGYGTVQERV